jgi:hypothetical protein
MFEPSSMPIASAPAPGPESIPFVSGSPGRAVGAESGPSEPGGGPPVGSGGVAAGTSTPEIRPSAPRLTATWWTFGSGMAFWACIWAPAWP